MQSLKVTTIGFCFNSLAPGKFEQYFGYLIFEIISVINGWGISCELALRWMSLDLTYDKSTWDQVMAWCRQSTSHYLSQWWPRSLLPYGVTHPQWVKAYIDGLVQDCSNSSALAIGITAVLRLAINMLLWNMVGSTTKRPAKYEWNL